MQATLSDVELAQFRAFALGSEILHSEFSLTSAEILALYTTPKEIVATPGTRYVHEFISAVLILDYVSADYAANGDLTIHENDGSGTAVSDTIAAADFLQASADAVHVVQALSADISLLAGSSLALCCGTGNPTTGDSPVRGSVAYRTHETGL